MHSKLPCIQFDIPCCWFDCRVLNSARYFEYSVYSLVFLYSASSLLYLSLAENACSSYGSFSLGDRLCQFSPTSFAISVKDKFRPLKSSRILFEKITYADGGLSGAFSSGLGCRRYLRLAPLVPLLASFASVFVPLTLFSSDCRSSLGVFREGDAKALSEDRPLVSAIFR